MSDPCVAIRAFAPQPYTVGRRGLCWWLIAGGEVACSVGCLGDGRVLAEKSGLRLLVNLGAFSGFAYLVFC